MKQRFSSLDVKVIAKELEASLSSLRLSNAYDLSSRIFLLKFAKPNARQSLVIDSGFKCYLTSFTRTTATAPSAFVARLRKFLRSRRVSSVRQVGTDRILEICFSDGQYHLFLEFYAGGNIILTDRELNVLALLRTVSETAEQELLRAGAKYSLEQRQNVQGVPPLSRDRIRDGIRNALLRMETTPAAGSKRGKKKPGEVLRQAVSASVTEFSPMLVEHALHATGFDTLMPAQSILEDDAALDGIMRALEEAKKLDSNLSRKDLKEGYIVAKAANTGADVASCRDEPDAAVRDGKLKYDDYHPFKPHHLEHNENLVFLPFKDFNTTIDEFYSSVESQKLDTRLTEKEESAKRKLENARKDHEKRLGGLQQAQELHVRKAQAIEANVQRVQEAILAVNSLLAQEMDWQNIAKLIEVEQRRKNTVATLIKLPLKLHQNTITLSLSEETFEDETDFNGDKTDSEVSDSEEESQGESSHKTKKGDQSATKALEVDIDLGLSPWANAREYYDQKRTAAVKEQRTIQSSQKALKSAERKIGADLKKSLQQEKDAMRPQRKAFWFEKFLYFISSEGYLILGGKDAQQTEILYRKHFRKGDIFVHADLNGAVSVVIQNRPNRVDDRIPPTTLYQAGTLSVSTSNAWDSKAIMAAWWVPVGQVSKIAPNGDLLAPGLFNIKGEKNFLPPAQLLLGFGLLFQISEASKARHHKHRIVDKSGEVVLEGSSPSARSQDPKDDQIDSIAELRIDSDDEAGSVVESEVDPEPGSDAEDDSGPTSNPLQPNGPDDAEDAHEVASSVRQVEREDDDAQGKEPDEVGGNPVVDPAISTTNNIANDELIEPVLDGGAEPIDGSIAADPSNSAATSLSTPPNVPKNQSQPHVRGKHGKRQKQKTKYAHQDEEDRALAMKLLGSAAAQDKARDLAAEKAAKEQEVAAQKERRRQQHRQNAVKGKEAELSRQKRLEAGDVGEYGVEDEGEAPAAVDLDAFVGAPLPGDEILDVLVVCGPWDAMGARCRWRAKLQPGATKKGRAVKEILGRWQGVIADGEKKKRPGAGAGNEAMIEEEKVRSREAELIRGIRDVEVVGVIPVGKVRVVLGAGERGAGGGGGKGGGGGGGGGRGGRKGGKGSKKK